jgi:potassium efflux system protein
MPSKLAVVLNSPKWVDGLRVLVVHLLVSPLQIAVVILLLFSLWKRSAVLDRLRATARSVGKPSADSMRSTLKALLYTIVLAAPWPLLALITGQQMIHGPASDLASAAFGDALLRMAPILFLLLLVRNLCLPGGVAEVHFQWLPEALVALRKELFLLGLTLLVPGVFLILAYAFAPPDQTFGFGQLIYLVPVFGLARFLYRLLYPGKSIIERLKRRPSVTYSPGLGWAWLIGTIALPVLMGVVAVAGFMYSASILLDRTVQTLLFALALALLSELAARWLLIARRRARLQEVLARRAAGREQDGAETTPSSSSTSSVIEGTAGLDSGEDLASLDSDSRKLINVLLSIVALLGIVAIWSPVFPALVNLSGITLWEHAQQVSGEQVIERVSLADILLALLLGALTYAAARSLPALVEIVLRQRGSVPSGSRLAFATLARYGIVLIGLGLVLSIVGVNWSKLQWLVAALGVGIGFGLQEIVANFISGLIILIERPVRVGDVVTVGEDTGRVVRIQIRATTIRKWDQQELIVPNKEFITSRVVNWSLSDETSRIFFMVGIAYGSDVEKALKLIEEAALENQVVLEEPPPLVTFESFGDNSLNLGLRCYVPSVSERLETTTALHLAINRKLNEAGIVIAFPQRDVHLDPSSPLEVRLFGAGAEKGSG